jgi:hypothetical protein
MSDGVLYKYNATTWSKSQAKKSNASTISDGVVRHANASTWFDNYPMEQLYDQTFDVVWTQGYNGAGAKLDAATWGDHPKSGDTIDFKGAWGFDRNAMRDFVADGVVQWVKIQVKFIDPAHAGNPDVWFAPHTYTAKPAEWSEANVNTAYQVHEIYTQTGGDIIRTMTFPAEAWLDGNLGGFRADGSAAAADSATFAGVTTSHGITAFNSRITIQVLK